MYLGVNRTSLCIQILFTFSQMGMVQWILDPQLGGHLNFITLTLNWHQGSNSLSPGGS